MDAQDADSPVARLNEVGDVVVEDARQIRALADPGRLRLFEWLQKHGPGSVDEVAASLAIAPQAARDQVAELAAAGLVERHDGQVVAYGRGLFLPPPSEDPEVQAGARALGAVMLGAVAGVPQHWLDHVEPRLDPEWAAAAGLFNAGVALTREELELVQQEVERALTPYVNRAEADRPAAATKVRVLAWFLPEADR